MTPIHPIITLFKECWMDGPDMAAERTREVGLQNSISPSFPIAVKKIIKSLQINLVHDLIPKENNNKILGSYSKDKKTMFINSEFDETMKRFVLSHMLGHLVLHGDQDFKELYHEPTNPIETQANIYAAHLLMPLWALHNAILKGYKVPQLMQVFGVSAAALSFQLDLLR